MRRAAVPALGIPARHREEQIRAEGYRHVAGVDEAGVGPLAGPVVAAAVILPAGLTLDGVRDSKLIGEEERERLQAEILAACVASAIGVASVAEIDEIGIHAAGELAMRRAVTGLAVPADYLMIDARGVRLELPQEGPVRGDRDHVCIAAASILAKVHRDRLMLRLDGEHPPYGFAEHKGYPTARHLAALSSHGTSPAHRCSWLAVREAAGLLSKEYYDLAATIRSAAEPDQHEALRLRLRAQRGRMDEGELARLRELLRRGANRRRGA